MEVGALLHTKTEVSSDRSDKQTKELLKESLEDEIKNLEIGDFKDMPYYTNPKGRDLLDAVAELRESVSSLQAENAERKIETTELKTEMASMKNQIDNMTNESEKYYDVRRRWFDKFKQMKDP